MEKKLVIIENALKEEDFIKIQNTLNSENFPWYLNKVLGDREFENNFQFTHKFYDNFNVNSDFYSLVIPILEILKPAALIKIKTNLLIKQKSIIEHGTHVDYTYKNSKTAIYYVNTNNGYTKFLDGTKILSEKNKLIIFNTAEEHLGTTCTDSLTRKVINFNYFPQE